MNRGTNRQTTFRDAEDYDLFLRFAALGHERFPVRVIALCLMPNHFHALVQTELSANLSKWLKWTSGLFAQAFNERHERVGRLWQDRFKAKAVREGRHLGTVWRYVEQNPVRASLCISPDDWRWSSAYFRSNKIRPPYLFEPPWWGSKMMQNWWSQESLDQETLDKVRLSLNRPDLHGDVEDWSDPTDTVEASCPADLSTHRH
jgi:putative transposase